MSFRKTFTTYLILGATVISLAAGFVLGVRAANVNSDVHLQIDPTNFVKICPNPTFNDLNSNGQRDSGESLLNGLETVLSSATRGDIETIQTDGSKCFKGIEEGVYTVTQTSPGATYISTTGGTSKSITATGNQVNVPFGYSAQTLICATPTFEDLNGNGVQDGNEQAIANVQTQLIGSNNAVIATLNTGNDNCFRVDSNLCTTQNPCKINQQICGLGQTNCNFVATCPIEYNNISVQPGGRVDYKFCYRQTSTLLCANPTFNDINGNSIKDAGDVDLVGVKTELLNSSGQVIDTIVTGGTNCFQLLSGDCTGTNPCSIRQPECPGSQTGNCSWEPTCQTQYNNLTVMVGDRLDKKFCYRTKARLICANPTYLDNNKNQVRDVGEQEISGVNTILTDSTGEVIGQFETGANDCFQIPEGKCSNENKCILSQQTPSDKITSCQNNYSEISVSAGETKVFPFCYFSKSMETIVIQMFSSVPQGPVLVNQRFDYQASLRNTSGVRLTNVKVSIPVDPKVTINPSTLRFGRINGRAYSFIDELNLGGLKAYAAERAVNYNSSTKMVEVTVPVMEENEEVNVTYNVLVSQPETKINLNIVGRASTYSDQFGTSQSPLISNTLIHLIVLSNIIPRTGGDLYAMILSNLIWIIPVILVIVIGIVLYINRRKWIKSINLKG